MRGNLTASEEQRSEKLHLFQESYLTCMEIFLGRIFEAFCIEKGRIKNAQRQFTLASYYKFLHCRYVYPIITNLEKRGKKLSSVMDACMWQMKATN